MCLLCIVYHPHPPMYSYPELCYSMRNASLCPCHAYRVVSTVSPACALCRSLMWHARTREPRYDGSESDQCERNKLVHCSRSPVRGSPVSSQPATALRCRGWTCAPPACACAVLRLAGPPDPPLAPRQKLVSTPDTEPRTQNACALQLRSTVRPALRRRREILLIGRTAHMRRRHQRRQRPRRARTGDLGAATRGTSSGRPGVGSGAGTSIGGSMAQDARIFQDGWVEGTGCRAHRPADKRRSPRSTLSEPRTRAIGVHIMHMRLRLPCQHGLGGACTFHGR